MKADVLSFFIEFVDAIEKELMEVDVQVDAPTKSLDQGNGTGFGL